MFTRILSSATVGIAVTTGLLFLMQYLVASGEEIITEPAIRHDLRIVRLKEKEEVRKTPTIIDRIAQPKTPPRTDVSDPRGDGDIGFNFPDPPKPPRGGATLTKLSFGDGPLINIFKVYPQYPVTAVSRALEGTVLVQYDVTSMGTVENVVVVESTNSIFNKAAIAAAYRFKYKPRIVDGVPYGTKGLRNLFRFEIEK